MVRRSSMTFALLVLFLLSASLAGASSVDLLTFEGLKNGQMVGNFYNGGGSAATPNFGVTFSSSVYALWPVFEGGAGNFSATLLGTPAIFINGITGSSSIGSMNVTGGFNSGINFFYTAAFKETITVWSGANGTGTILATLAVGPNDSNCTTVGFCNWSDIGLSFSGTAQSVTFSGPANTLGISDITLGQSTSAIPEPSSFYLLGTGLAGFCIQQLRRLRRG